jgi:hypothetical protein
MKLFLKPALTGKCLLDSHLAGSLNRIGGMAGMESSHLGAGEAGASAQRNGGVQYLGPFELTIFAGAIYAHDARKEDLFLELKEHRAHPKFAPVRKNIESEPDVRKRLVIFRRWLSSQVGDPSWGALRHGEGSG